MRKLLCLFCILFVSKLLFAQNAEWINYTNGQSIISVIADENNVWIGTNG